MLCLSLKNNIEVISETRSGFRRFVSSKRLDGKFGVTKIEGECPERKADLDVLYLLRDWTANSVLPKS